MKKGIILSCMALLVSSHAFSSSIYMDDSVVNTKYNKVNNSKQNYKRANSFNSLRSSHSTNFDDYDTNETLDNSIIETDSNSTSSEWDDLWEDRDISEEDLALEDDSVRSSNFYTTSTEDDHDAILDFKKANNFSGNENLTKVDDEYEAWRSQFLEDREEIADDNMYDNTNKNMRNNLTRR